jgi:hypothetical protein
MGIFGRLRRGGEERVAQALGHHDPERRETVRSFGVTSAGRGQVRGTGTLGLDADTLVFAMWWPRREVRIPRAAILGVDTPRGHLGKTSGRRLLRVHWTTEAGVRDAIGLEVGDVDAWIAALGAPLIDPAGI